jgi:predicted Fe-S protein YdhL (DUF1289 family)
MEINTSRAVMTPCVGICTLDPETDLCKGCWRSREEVASWATARDDLRRFILANARRRREKACLDDAKN